MKAFLVHNETPEEGRWKYRLKHCEYNNGDEDNSLNILSDKNLGFVFTRGIMMKMLFNCYIALTQTNA